MTDQLAIAIPKRNAFHGPPRVPRHAGDPANHRPPDDRCCLCGRMTNAQQVAPDGKPWCGCTYKIVTPDSAPDNTPENAAAPLRPRPIAARTPGETRGGWLLSVLVGTAGMWALISAGILVGLHTGRVWSGAFVGVALAMVAALPLIQTTDLLLRLAVGLLRFVAGLFKGS